MAIQWVQIDSAEDKRWRHFLHEVPVVPFSWDERFLTVVQDVFHYVPYRVVLMENNQPRVGGVFLIRQRLGQQFAIAPFFAFYLPIMTTDPSWVGRFNDLDRFLAQLEETFQSVECVQLPGGTLCLPFVWRRWQVTVQSSGLLPIHEPETTLQAMEAEERRLIRRAMENKQLQPVTVEDPRPFYQLLEAVYQRHGTRPPFSRRRFVHLVEGFTTSGLGQAIGITADDQLQAATLVIPHGNTVYGLMLARQTTPLGSQAGLKLIWHLVERFSGEGFEWYDLGGLEIPSIARFKLKLGAIPKTVYRCRFVKNRRTRWLHHLASFKNKTLRHLW